MVRNGWADHQQVQNMGCGGKTCHTDQSWFVECVGVYKAVMLGIEICVMCILCVMSCSVLWCWTLCSVYFVQYVGDHCDESCESICVCLVLLDMSCTETYISTMGMVTPHSQQFVLMFCTQDLVVIFKLCDQWTRG